MNRMHEANRKGWDAVSPHWQAMIEERVDWRKCATDPTIALSHQELEHLEDLSGKDHPHFSIDTKNCGSRGE